MRSAILFILFIIFCPGKIFSQQPDKFHISYYTTENGLPSNGIKGLQWDEQSGFLWIATESGVSRFNGLDFKNFTIENTPFIESERMLYIVKNNKGKIYAADQSGNILTVNKNKFLLYQKTKDEPGIAFNKRFTISISDTFFKDKTFYKGSRPFTLLFDYNLPTSDTSTFIIYNSKIFVLNMGMPDAIAYKDTTQSVRNGFKLKDKCFFINKAGTI